MEVLIGLVIGASTAAVVVPLFGNYVARAERRVRHQQFFERPH